MKTKTTISAVQVPAPEKQPPGSLEATKQGCTCPVFDNCKGRGCGLTDKDGKPLYYINEKCPLHVAKFNRLENAL